MLYVIYVNYGPGTTFRTGPMEARHRQGLWAHFYRRVHAFQCSCLRCLERVSLGPVPSLPLGRKTGRMYKAI